MSFKHVSSQDNFSKSWISVAPERLCYWWRHHERQVLALTCTPFLCVASPIRLSFLRIPRRLFRSIHPKQRETETTWTVLHLQVNWSCHWSREPYIRKNSRNFHKVQPYWYNLFLTTWISFCEVIFSACPSVCISVNFFTAPISSRFSD